MYMIRVRTEPVLQHPSHRYPGIPQRRLGDGVAFGCGRLLGVSDVVFIRFVVDRPHPTLDAELGMFTALEDIDFDEQKGSVQRAHEEAWYWFSRSGGGGLYRPRLTGKVRSQAVRKSLFWFKAEAGFAWKDRGAVVERARQLAQVMEAAGVEVRELRTSDPGEVVWEDMKQVLARPSGPIQRAF